jgi:hypothetical protein
MLDVFDIYTEENEGVEEVGEFDKFEQLHGT